MVIVCLIANPRVSGCPANKYACIFLVYNGIHASILDDPNCCLFFLQTSNMEVNNCYSTIIHLLTFHYSCDLVEIAGGNSCWCFKKRANGRNFYQGTRSRNRTIKPIGIFFCYDS